MIIHAINVLPYRLTQVKTHHANSC